MITLPSFFVECNPEALRASLDDPAVLYRSFLFDTTDEGHNYWHNIADYGHTDESRNKITEMIAMVDQFDFSDNMRTFSTCSIPSSMAIVAKLEYRGRKQICMGSYRVKIPSVDRLLWKAINLLNLFNRTEETIPMSEQMMDDLSRSIRYVDILTILATDGHIDVNCHKKFPIT
ncbi:MAG: hypothetical protein WC284_14785 [Candidimonas sp.]